MDWWRSSIIAKVLCWFSQSKRISRDKLGRYKKQVRKNEKKNHRSIYPMEEAAIERFSNGTKVEEIVIKTKFWQKLKSFVPILGNSGKKNGGGRVPFTFYILCQSLWGSSPAVNSNQNSIRSQNDYLEVLESSASHFLSTVPDEIGLVDHHTKSQENPDSSDDAAHNKDVNGNHVCKIQRYFGREKEKTFLKNLGSQDLSTCMGAVPQIFQFTKEDLNIRRKPLEQLTKARCRF